MKNKNLHEDCIEQAFKKVKNTFEDHLEQTRNFITTLQSEIKKEKLKKQ
jgi:trans-2-enoyl-CoA reductase